MRTVLDLLDPPCPREALGPTFAGLDLDAPAFVTLAEYWDRYVALLSEFFRVRDELFGTHRERVDDQVRRAAIENSPARRALSDFEESPYNHSTRAFRRRIRRRWNRLRHRARARVARIFPDRVPARSLMRWIEASAGWHWLARETLGTALGLGRPVYQRPPSDKKKHPLGEPLTWRHGLHEKTLPVNRSATVLRAADAWVAIEPDLSAPISSWILGNVGHPAHARVLADGDLIAAGECVKSYWRDSLLRIVGAELQPATIDLSQLQEAYIWTFLERFDSLLREPTEQPGEAPLAADATLGEETGDQDVITIRLPDYGWMVAGLRDAAYEAGWSHEEIKNPVVLRLAAVEERLRDRFEFLPAELHLSRRCTRAPFDEAIRLELRRLLWIVRRADPEVAESIS